MNRILFPLALCFCCATPLSLIAEESDSAPSSDQAQSHQRHVPLDGQPNFRDIGGYQTKKGQTIAWGKIYRSGILHKLSNSDVEKIDGLGIKTVVNFLTENEIEHQGKDKLPVGVKEVFIPISAENALGAITDDLIVARQTGDFSKIPAEVNPDIHRAAITSANAEYKEFMQLLADPNNYPIAFHCSHGVHRTGTATAILLSALGVPWKTIREDYLLSNKYRAKENTKRIEQLVATYAETKNIPVEEVDRSDIEAFYLLQGSYIDASLEQAIKDYGSMEEFISEGLEIDAATLEKIQSNLLISNQ